eukprot:4205031-Prymnesium_polylepis.1
MVRMTSRGSSTSSQTSSTLRLTILTRMPCCVTRLRCTSPMATSSCSTLSARVVVCDNAQSLSAG